MATHNSKHASDLEWISNGSPQFVGDPEPEKAVPISVNLRWGVVHRAEDGSVHLKKNIEMGVAALSGSEDGGSIYEGDYDTDDEHVMYQGVLHSSRGSTYKTNKRMFVDVSKVKVGQLILVRSTDSSENPIELCKVIERE